MSAAYDLACASYEKHLRMISREISGRRGENLREQKPRRAAVFHRV